MTPVPGEMAVSVIFVTAGLFQAKQTETRIEWQGDPSIELGDDMSITDITATKKYKGYCIGNQYKFDGGLRVITRMKTLETEAL
jgi:hypothetical protein